MSHSILVVLITITLILLFICLNSCRKNKNDCKKLQDLYLSHGLVIEKYILELQSIVKELNGLGSVFNKISLNKAPKKKKIKNKKAKL